MIGRYLRGDQRAFEALFDRHGGPLLRFCRSLAGSVEGEDLCQAAWLEAVRSLPGYRGRGSFAAWLHGIAVNLWRDSRRRVAVPTVPLDDWPAGGADPADLAEQAARAAAIEAALSTLDPEHRLVVLLHEVAGFRYREIAGLLGCPLGTVKSRLHYALAHLRVALQATWKGELMDELPTR